MDSFNQLIEQIKFHLNDYLKEKKVEFTHGKIKCLNPNHEDNHPSMSYVPNTGDKSFTVLAAVLAIIFFTL